MSKFRKLLVNKDNRKRVFILGAGASKHATRNLDIPASKNYHQPYFLKLHGSINWYYCGDKTCIRHNIPAVIKIDSGDLSCFWSCDYCGALLNLMIIPPHAHKSYRTNRFYSLQAKIASTKLENADELIIIGYSFPDFDFEANALFRRASIEYVDLEWYTQSKKIIIVNPEVESKSYIDKINNLFSINKSGKNDNELILYNNIDDFIKDYD